MKLNGISINGGLLPIDPALFMPPASDGFYIDSGTENSLLVGKVYDILQQGMVDYFQDYYGWLPLNRTARLDHYELCSELPSEGRCYVHFEGTANLELDENSIFKVFDQANQFCMTILRLGSKEGPNILGALQQANYRFLFDAAASKLSSAKDIC
ncbi:uncharacterized protein LOC133744225 [Rosa rugosa]|uniref:uncharacterized protein LOC133744225 n=1 Tax=Rosa rugosa TaxID=74645 RepID=UPI002B40CCE4|nr:uncharacterized protein LOC133744225 [Rosa rugosa]